MQKVNILMAVISHTICALENKYRPVKSINNRYFLKKSKKIPRQKGVREP